MRALTLATAGLATGVGRGVTTADGAIVGVLLGASVELGLLELPGTVEAVEGVGATAGAQAIPTSATTTIVATRDRERLSTPPIPICAAHRDADAAQSVTR